MIVSYYHLTHFERSQRAIKASRPDARWVYTTPGEPHLYPDDVAKQWNQGDDLLIVEGDIVAGPMDYQLMEDCPFGWCAAPYPLGTSRKMFGYGYGFTKFSKGFQAGLPYEDVQFHGLQEYYQECLPCQHIEHYCEDCQDRVCHLHQDTYMWHELIRRFGVNVRPHWHRPVQHLHLGHRELVDAKMGLMTWRAPHPWAQQN